MFTEYLQCALFINCLICAAMALNTEQAEAMTLILGGHNVILLGAAGTGKTFTVKSIVKELKTRKKVVYVTATTGIACTQYESAMTIHKWSGIGDGRYSPDALKELVEHGASFGEVRHRIMNTDILFVDECSMFSKRLFLSLKAVCAIRNAYLPFGGIQIVLCGDFRQLPPVPNDLYGEDGEFCFNADHFNNMFPHRITLKHVIRQSELPLIQAISETAEGNVLSESVELLVSLKRPLEQTSVKLFASNEQVDDYNRQAIMKFQGDLFEFQSEDLGNQKYLHGLLAPKILWLKKGAPVMLLRNLSDKLVNGLLGTVIEIKETGPVVEFESVQLKIPMEKLKFSVFSPKENKDVAVRIQYPIKLAFAMTIHKAQGLTLDSVEVDCKRIFKPGQLSVALGRARSTNGLRVLNFSTQYCFQMPETLKMFYQHFEIAEPKDDLTCCREATKSCSEVHSTANIFTVQDMLELESFQASQAVDYIQENDDFDEEFDTIIGNMMEFETDSVQLPEDLNLQDILADLHCEHVVTPMQYSINQILEQIDQQMYSRFCKVEFEKLSSLLSEYKIDLDSVKPLSSSDQCKFYAAVHKYHNSFEFKMNCMSLFDTSFTEDHLHICYGISVKIRHYVIKKVADKYPTSNRNISQRNVTDSSMAKVRYVAGYCVAKVRFKFYKQKQTHRYDASADGQAKYKTAVVAVDICDCLKTEEQLVHATTAYPSSLEDVERKQNKHHSLVYVSDPVHEIFMKITDKCMTLLVDKTLNEKGSYIFQHIFQSICSDEIFDDFFFNVVSMIEASEEQIHTVYEKLVKRYLMVLLNQFRKDILEHFNVAKKMAHRKQVRVSSQGKGRGKKSVSVSDDNISTLGKADTSGLKAKKRIEDQSTIESRIIESDEEKIKDKGKGKGKGKKTNKSSVEIDIGPEIAIASERRISKRKRTVRVVDSSDSDDNISALGKAGTSGLNAKQRIENQSTTESSIITDKEDESEICAVCNTYEKDNEWIQCDGCDSWNHRQCAGLKTQTQWKKANRKRSKWFCKACI